MKILVLGGFLGSGKTTVLLQLAKYFISQCQEESSYPVVILENEISSAGVDNQILSQNNFTVENIFTGCICCSSTASLCDSIRQIENSYHPAWILIEATGMAYPDNISRTLQQELSLPTGILTLVDGKRWNKVSRAMPDFVNSQLTDADIILVNKIDLITEDDLNSVINDVRQINHTASLYPICAVNELNPDFWNDIYTQFLAKLED